MIGYIWLAYVVGVVCAYIICNRNNKKLKKANAHLANESDFYFITGQMMFKKLTPDQQAEHESSPEYQRAIEAFQSNKRDIDNKGTY